MHREAVGKHINWLDGKQGTQKSQNQLVQWLADRPGLHADNAVRRNAAQTFLQFLSLLSSVQGSHSHFATSSERIEELTMENRLTHADALYQQQREDQATRREFNRQSGQETKGQETKQEERLKKRSVVDQKTGKTDPHADIARINSRHDARMPLPKQASTGQWQSASSLSLDGRAPAEADVPSDSGHLPLRAHSGAGDMEPKPASRSGGAGEQQQMEPVSPVGPQPFITIFPGANVMMLNETLAHDFLAAFVGGDDGKFMADEISKVTAGKELILTSISQPRMSKRAALSMLEAHDAAVYGKYLKENCHIRTKTVHGHPIGDRVLVAGEYVRNPWRAMTEKLNSWIHPQSELGETAATATEFVNAGTDILFGFLSVGVYPIIKYGSAKSLSVLGHGINGDMTCMKREFSPAEMARLMVDTEVSVTHHSPFPLFTPKPAGITGAGKFKPAGLFIEEHLPSRIQMEKYMSIRKDGTELLIREKAPGEFVTYHPRVAQSAQLEQRVIFDTASQRIFFADDVAREHGYEFNIVEGRKFIDIRGEQFELHVNPDKQRLEIQLDHGDVSSQLPVYKEKLSHTWHLEVENHNAVFDDRQKMLIDGMKFNLDDKHMVSQIDNLNPKAYGSGKLHEVRNADAAPSDAADLLVVEMHGELVPVRIHIVDGHGVGYEAFETSAPGKRGHPVEWDGLRWIFEKETSVHVTPELLQLVANSNAAMHDQRISVAHLSAPDQRGVRWGEYDRGFLKIDGGFVQVRKSGHNPDAWFIAHEGTKTSLIFRDNRFHLENFRHRLQRMKEGGMSGNGGAQAPGSLGWARERTAVEIIQSCFGYTPEQAVEYLRQFHFESNGLRNEREFALYVESYDAIPEWARPVRINEAPQAVNPSANAAADAPANTNANAAAADAAASTGSRINMGQQIGDGAEGVVYLDATDNNYVIKRLEDRYFSPDADGNLYDFDITVSVREALASRDVELFNRYYGEGMAETIIENGQVYIRMPRVPGRELRLIRQGEIPEDGVERYVDMVERLANVGIWHGDLHPRNIMFDPESRTFYPIDFSNIRERFMTAEQRERASLNFIGESQWAWVIAAIRARMVRPGPSRQRGPEPGPSRQFGPG